MKNLSQTKIINDVLENVREDMNNEEIIHLVLEKQISQEINDKKITRGQKTADKIAKYIGCWTFIIVFSLILITWMMINIMRPFFDPFPFILLNLFLSCVAAIQAPIIMMSQNRQDEKDRQHALNDYRVGLKTEIIIQDLHNKLDTILQQQEDIIHTIEELNKKSN